LAVFILPIVPHFSYPYIYLSKKSLKKSYHLPAKKLPL